MLFSCYKRSESTYLYTYFLGTHPHSEEITFSLMAKFSSCKYTI